MPAAEKPARLAIPSPDARSARSPFGGRPAGFLDVGGVAASGILTLGANAGDGDIVTIDSKVYAFQDTLTNSDGNVHIGATASDTLDNFIAAITLGAGGGTDYAAAMTLHPTVTAAAGTGDTMDATAKDQGVAGNTIVTTTDIGSAAWAPVATMGGGLDPEDAVAFVPIVQWGKMRIRLQITGADGTIGVEFVRPARDRVVATGLALVYGEDQPGVDGDAWVDGVELTLEITVVEHVGENWLKLTLSPTDDGAVLDFLDISGELLGLYH